MKNRMCFTSNPVTQLPTLSCFSGGCRFQSISLLPCL